MRNNDIILHQNRHSPESITLGFLEQRELMSKCFDENYSQTFRQGYSGAKF